MEQQLVSLIGQLGAVGGMAFIVWKALQAHAVEVRAFMAAQVKELTMLRAEVRTLIEVLGEPPRPGRRLRTSPGLAIVPEEG